MKRLVSLWLCCAACPRPVPDHLRVTPDPKPTTSAEVTDTASALRAMLGRDPLARSPVLLDPSLLDALPGGEALAAFTRQVKTVESGQGAMDSLLQQVEDEWRGSAAVPLSRGYRLRLAENLLSNKLAESEVSEQSIVSLITPLTRGIADPTLPRRPLEWLGAGTRIDAESEGANIDHTAAIRRYAERWVLTGWLSAPTLPAAVPSELLQAPQYDTLRSSRLGALLVARASGASADPTKGLAALQRATLLALTRASADRDSEQADWAAQKKQAAAELGDEDPVGKLLELAADDLLAAASSDRAAGGVLLASAALRWIDRCDIEPCTGLDRVETFGHAARWDQAIAALAAIWQVVALKETIDSLDVGRETALFPDIAVNLADVLLGTGAGPIEAPVLRKQRPDPQTWLVVGRAVGSEGISDWEGARVALGKHLEAEVLRAIALTSDETTRFMLERIGKRAVP